MKNGSTIVPQCMTNWYDHSDAQEQRKSNSQPLSSNGYAMTRFLLWALGASEKAILRLQGCMTRRWSRLFEKLAFRSTGTMGKLLFFFRIPVTTFFPILDDHLLNGISQLSGEYCTVCYADIGSNVPRGLFSRLGKLL
jgi:hypothetical protein